MLFKKYMKLTSYTDFSIRVLMYLSIQNDRLVTAGEISAFYGISRNHLSKIVHNLSKLGLLESFKGNAGGIKLAVGPAKINLGKLIRELEPDFNIVECFDSNTDNCRISSVCKLKKVLSESKNQFLKNLDRYTLQDITKNRSELEKQIELE